MNLIANSGIQYFTIPLSVDINDNYKMFFHEWFDIEKQQLKLEIAHNFAEEEVWVRKRDLSVLGFLHTNDGEINGNSIDRGNVNSEWTDIKKEFIEEDYKTIPIETETPKESGCFKVDLRKIQWDKIENKWLPFPFFTLNSYGKSEFGPINWCRCKIVPKSTDTNEKEYNLVFAFDTRTKYEDDGFEEDELLECPVFVSSHEESKDFAICDDEFKLIDFCSEAKNCGWVDNYLLKLFHNVTDFDGLKIKKPQLNYLAQYIYVLQYIQKSKILPGIKLFSDKNVGSDNVDLVVDVGNSRTRAILFDNSDFTKVEPLALQNFTNLVKDNKLNRNSDSFEMRLAFREADFGGRLIEGSSQFGFPSMVRVGEEANELIHKATNLNTGVEKVTTFSSPKRYLWDTKVQGQEWEFVTLEDEESKSIWIEGISQQINPDGSFNAEGQGGIATFYSRSALMTFCFLEILAQAKMQINSYQFRKNWGKESTPRKIGRIIITCPTAMSKLEQIALRRAAEDAIIVLSRFYAGSSDWIDEREARGQIKVIPSVKGLSDKENSDEWIYDEPTCAQFVYLYTEVKERYLKNTKEYFDFYGKVRSDLGDYDRKSVTIGSVDIGGGTTDMMIAAYKDDDKGECKLTPVPLFWESFYTAGDDLLKDLVKQLVIEGEYSAIENHLRTMNKDNIAELVLDFFGKDNARQSLDDRQIRKEFNIQVAVPVVNYYLQLLNEDKTEKATLSFNDIFASNLPTDRVTAKFKSHFGFTISDIMWKYDKEVLSKMVKRTFDNLVSKISTILSYYGCDIVLLTGRPTSLKPLSDLFLKYYAVAPNRLIRLNNYRVGTWYPFHDGKGYFDDPKSIVPVGAMIGNYASTRGSLNGFSLDLSQLNTKLQPTTEYFAKDIDGEAFISPQSNNGTLEISQLPIRIWTRQLDTTSYPTRPFYNLAFNKDKIEELVIQRFDLSKNNIERLKEETENRLESLQKLGPFKFNIVREEYPLDKETLIIESVVDRNGDDLATTYFSFQIQSMSEDKGYWLDTGEFSNLNINHN